jgi:hypothetical protein
VLATISAPLFFFLAALVCFRAAHPSAETLAQESNGFAPPSHCAPLVVHRRNCGSSSPVPELLEFCECTRSDGVLERELSNWHMLCLAKCAECIRTVTSNSGSSDLIHSGNYLSPRYLGTAPKPCLNWAPKCLLPCNFVTEHNLFSAHVRDVPQQYSAFCTYNFTSCASQTHHAHQQVQLDLQETVPEVENMWCPESHIA